MGRTVAGAIMAPEPWEVELSGLGAGPALELSSGDALAALAFGAEEIRNFCILLTRTALRETLVLPVLRRTGAVEKEMEALWTPVTQALGLEDTANGTVRPDAQALSEAFKRRFTQAAPWEREDAEQLVGCVFHVLDTGTEEKEKAGSLKPTQVYSRMYNQFYQALVVAGCTLDGSDTALVARDYNICFSMGDILVGPEDEGPPSKTQFLNSLANNVARVLINGAEEDGILMAERLKEQRDTFLRDYQLGDFADTRIDKSTTESDSVWFYDAMIDLCETGMATAIAQEEAARARSFCWANALQRLLGLLVQEMGLRLEGAESIEDPIFTRFVSWESQLRRNITSNYGWNKHPRDLQGTWSLSSFTTSYARTSQSSAEQQIGDASTMRLVFEADGKGTVSMSSGTNQPFAWSLSPGPTHLDTCNIRISTQDDSADLFFTGYIDRGQRLETKFSKRPVLMSGRVTRRRRDGTGVARPMGRFSLTQNRG
uniref:Uncharacterized protein n=1 Tax=Pinguiococcus pyrenoidosus TaxID=172671 RepID=A0A7R9UG48_9STRA